VILRVAKIDDVDEEVCELHLLERGLERLDDRVREFADESDRVGEKDFLVVRERDLAGRRVEGGEKLVHREHSSSREAVEERGFSGVRVADERGDRPVPAEAALALDAAVFPDLLEVAFEAGDPFLDTPPVNLELGFARASRADSAALAREVRPHAGEAWQEVLELGQLDLEAALLRAGALGEDVEDELRAVEDFPRHELFEVPALRRRELVSSKMIEVTAFSSHSLAISSALPLPM